MSDALTDLSVEELLRAVADESTAVASGATAATAATLAAGLVTMSARRSTGWPGASAAVGQGEVLRRRAAGLIDESATAFDRAAGELAVGTTRGHEPTPQRDWQLGEALRRAADVPLAVAGTALDIATLAAEVAESCEEAARPDAVAATVLAESAVAIAVHLVCVNLLTESGGSDRERANELAEVAKRLRNRVFGS